MQCALPEVIARTSIADWLDDHADVPVRLIVAPPGFGKSTAMAAYAAAPSPRRRMRLTIDARTAGATIARAVDEARAFAGAPPVDIIIDDVHLASEATAAVLNDRIADRLPDIFFILGSQRRDVVDGGSLFVRGRIAICDQSRLALTADEARTFLGDVAVAPQALAALIARTDGWPPAVIGTLREMTRASLPIESAYERWRARWSITAIDLVTTLLERVPAAERAAIRRHFARGTPLDQATLAVLHRCGFFVRFAAGTFALMAWIDELYPATRTPDGARPTLEIDLFGRFTARVDGVPIVWARRRDQQIMKYLALQPDGSATRAHLADIFWPGTPRSLAMQNLRTACSTIRRAIARVVGIEAIDSYFIAGERLSLDRTAIVCDVDLFRRYVTLAEAADAAGSLGDAIVHLRAAEALYGNGLFAGDINEPLFRAEAQEFAAIYARVLARLSGALIERGAPELARDYAAKAHKLGFLERRGAAGSQIHLRFAAS